MLSRSLAIAFDETFPIMKSVMFNRAGAQGLRCAGKASQRMSMGTLATWRTPKVANEPNVSDGGPVDRDDGGS